MKEIIVNVLEDNKCSDVEYFKCKEYISENIILATVLNGIHASAVAEKLVLLAKTHNMEILTDGVPQDGWIAVEIESYIVHLMIKDKREYFNIEELLTILKQKA